MKDPQGYDDCTSPGGHLFNVAPSPDTSYCLYCSRSKKQLICKHDYHEYTLTEVVCTKCGVKTGKGQVWSYTPKPPEQLANGVYQYIEDNWPVPPKPQQLDANLISPDTLIEEPHVGTIEATRYLSDLELTKSVSPQMVIAQTIKYLLEELAEEGVQDFSTMVVRTFKMNDPCGLQIKVEVDSTARPEDW
jgi:hypothetical protein